MTTAGRGRMAAVLFTDLVGSTELLSRLGEAAYDDLRRAHFAALREAIARSAGAEVKTTGDGLLATFSSAADAVTCAVGMQQAVDVHGRTAGVPLAIRVGLAVGDVIFEDGDVFGAPLVEAARLVAVARGGQILATSVVRAIAGGRCTAAFAHVGPLELKGLPAAVETCEVAWQPLPVASVPLPSLLTDMGRIFVGREAEQESLGRLWEQASAGERRVALIAGEPGVGKTRLAAELARQAHAEGGLVLAGRCDEDLGVPYQPFVEALRHFVDHAPDLTARLGRYGGELVRLLPELGERVQELPAPLRSDPETERYRLFDAVASWLAAASAEEPLLLVLDDLQWAAKPTLMLLRHVAQSAREARLHILGIYRDTELTHDHPLVEVIADLRRQGGVRRVSLSGLDGIGVAAIVEQAAGGTLDEHGLALARAIHEETEGNPFFVREVLRHLAESGAVERHEGVWAARLPIEELGIPEGVRDVIGRRLSRLAVDTHHALRVAAVAGTEFELAVVQAAAKMEEERLLAALEEAAHARLVTDTSATTYRFSHALVRATLYEELTAARRVSLHRHVAEALESCHEGALDDYLPALAHHWARASAPSADTARAVDYATRAGDRALALLAHDEAAAYYQQALDFLDAVPGSRDGRRRIGLLIALGEAQLRSGDPAHRQTLLVAGRLARDLGDAEGCARAALANQRGMYSRYSAVDFDRVRALEDALEGMGVADTASRARLLAALATELYFAADDRRHALGDEALAVARRLGDEATLAQVLALVWMATWDPATVDSQATRVSELVELASRFGDPMLEFHAGMALFHIAMHQGDIVRADSGLEACGRIAEHLGQPALRWRVLLARANRALTTGSVEGVARWAEEALRLGQSTGQPDSVVYHCSALATVRMFHGQYEEAVALMLDHEWLPPFRAALSWAYAELGRPDDARSILDGFMSGGLAGIPRDRSWLFTLCFLGRACVRLGDLGAASELYHLLLPCRREMAQGIIVWIGPVAHDLGLLAAALGRYDDAEQHFAAAAESQERIGALVTLAQTRLEWSRMLLTRRGPRDKERASELVRQALSAARELSLANVERRADALLGQVS